MNEKLYLNTIKIVNETVNNLSKPSFIEDEIIIYNNIIEIYLFPNDFYITLNDNITILTDFFHKKLDEIGGGEIFSYVITVFSTLEEFEKNIQPIR